MVQHSNEHLTITQLSAYRDKELTSDELTLCDAHLQSCRKCQAILADLKFTSTLLRSMPQVEVPRSFTLPLNMMALPATPDRETLQRPQSVRSQRVLRRTLRALSTLAAVIGLIFILTAALASLPHGGFAASSTASNPSLNSISKPATATPPMPGNHASPSVRGTQQAAASATERTQTHSSPTQTPAVPAFNHANQPPEPQFTLPPALDLSQPTGRLSIGVALLILGILGALLTRGRQRESRR